MTNSLSIVPSETKLRQWESLIFTGKEDVSTVLNQAFQAGADQELKACCELLPGLTNYLREERRPKPPSLKEQALKELASVDKNLLLRNVSFFGRCDAIHTIRRALEALPDE